MHCLTGGSAARNETVGGAAAGASGKSRIGGRLDSGLPLIWLAHRNYIGATFADPALTYPAINNTGKAMTYHLGPNGHACVWGSF